MVIGRELPNDLIADVLRRLPPRSQAASRCVCRAWRDLVDARRLLRADLLPRSIGGIFMNYCELYSTEFLSRPTAGPSISGDLEFVPAAAGITRVLDHCSGLLLLTDFKDGFVANPATRRWARLPPCPWPPPSPTTGEAFYWIRCLVYDPTVSPHYEVFFMPSVPEPKPCRDTSSYTLKVFSSRTGCWEERSFLAEEEHWEERFFVVSGGRAAYWREALYVPLQNDSVLRISMSNGKCRMVPRLSDVKSNFYRCSYLGTSEKGVYCAFEYDWHELRIFSLNESSSEIGWELKHHVDLRSFACKMNVREHHSQKQKGPWILQDVNYYKYPLGNSKQKEAVEDNFQWNSDDDNVLDTEDMVEGGRWGITRFLGFHPYEEIAFFFDVNEKRAIAYHWNTSKFQDLGNIRPRDYNEVIYCSGIENSFIYTPCWMEEFPENNLDARVEE